GAARGGAALPAVPATAAGGDQPARGRLPVAVGAGRLPPGAVGVRGGGRGDAAVRPAVVPAEDRSGAAGGGVAAEPGVRPVHLPGPAADRVGAGPARPPADAAALAPPLDRPGAAPTGRRLLRAAR